MFDNKVFKVKDDITLTLRGCATYGNVTRAAVANACRDGRLKAIKNSKGQWLIKKSDYDDYRLHRHSRRNYKRAGKRVFDIADGMLSCPMVSKIFSDAQGYEYPLAKVYYDIRTGRLKASKSGRYYVVSQSDAKEFWNRQQQAQAEIAS